ncbi:MAG: response regulator transcription factor [Phycisphaerae bacterium]|nr:response regulator transcription factor [Phycisphaerae bacterium]
MDTITVVLGHDQVLVVEALRAALEGCGAARVVASAREGVGAMDAVLRERPRVALLASTMPGRSALDVADGLRAMGSPTRGVVIGSRGDEGWAVFAGEGGSGGGGPLAGYVAHDDTMAGVVTAIRRAAGGGRYVSERVRETRPEVKAVGLFEPVPPVDRLSLREREVLVHLARGLSVKEAAAVLSLSRKTVDNHAQRLMAKLDIHTRAGLVRFAIREHLMSA